MELHKKFDDDWYNMYKPLTLENTILSGGTLTKDINETLEKLIAKTSKNEKQINALDICWIDLNDDTSVFTTNERDRLLDNNK